MGYWVKSVRNIPTHFDWYFFLVGDYRNHSFINDFFRDDFMIIADRIHENTALIAQNSHLERDLQNSLKDAENGKLGWMISKMEEKSPGLLVINKHPSLLNNLNEIMYKARKSMPSDWSEPQKNKYLTDIYNKNFRNAGLQKDTSIIYVPFTNIENAYSSQNELMADLIAFSKGANKELVRKTSKGELICRRLSASLSLNLGIVAIDFEL